MAQLSSGVRAFLGNPYLYDFFQKIVGSRKFLKIYVTDYLLLKGYERILDIGCGTASILKYLPQTVDYVGVDASPLYIKAANNRYNKGRGNFFCQNVTHMTLKEMGKFDVVMANGLIHHLDNNEVASLCRVCVNALSPGGKLITFDPCYSKTQSRVARYVISRDRGQDVRVCSNYPSLLQPYFKEVHLSVRHDMLYIPYSHAIMVGIK